jgi:Fic family protein
MRKNKYKMTLEHNIMYAKRNIIDSIYSEARLEGIGVTYPDTMEIFEGRTVAGLTIEETLKINSLKHAWQFVFDNIDYPVDLRFIRQINSEIGDSVIIEAGNLRTIDVKIGGTTWKPEIPDSEKASRYILNIINNPYFSTTDKAISIMLYVMRSQLFMDGNKRTAQLIANKIMIEGGAGIICIPVEKQREFVTLLVDFYESNNQNKISEFIYDYCIDGFDSEKITKQEN